MRLKKITTCWVFLFILHQSTTALADGDAHFKAIQLKYDGTIETVTTACLNQTMDKDLIIIQRLGEYPNYHNQINLVHAQNSFFKIAFKPPADVPWGWGISGDCKNGQSLLLFYHNHIRKLNFDNSALSNDSEYPMPAALFTYELGSLPKFPIVDDFNNDGETDVLWPSQATNQFVLYLNQFTAHAKAISLDYQLTEYVRGNAINQPLAVQSGGRISHWLPEITRSDYNGDGLMDLILVWLDSLTVYQTDKNHQIPERATVKRWFNQLSEAERLQSNSSNTIRLGQSGADRAVDILVNKSLGSIAHLKTTTTLYQRKAANQETSRLLNRQSSKAAAALWQDINGDDHDDIITVEVQSGLFATIQALLSNTIDIRFHFYLAKADGTIPDKPDFQRELGFKFHTDSFTPYGFMPSLIGDFNGDKLRDAVYGKDQNSLYLILQRPSGALFPQSISYKGQYPLSEYYLIDDINLDGYSDMIFWYRQWQRRGEVLVLQNLRNWN